MEMKARTGSIDLKLAMSSLALRVQLLRAPHKMPVIRLLQAAPAQGALSGQEWQRRRPLSLPRTSTHGISLDPAEILHQQLQMSLGVASFRRRPSAGAMGR